MLLKLPSYCKKFKCIADRCKDNCCIGWEIDIDDTTAEYYDSVKGDFGDKLKANINKDEISSFILKDERCPFLNCKNLCEIIINLGEDKLCQICRDHPRYFEWYSDIKEGGIGLCCEEAARIIVTDKEPFSTYDIPCDDEGYDDYNPELYNLLLFARDQIISTLQNESLTFQQRVDNVLNYALQVQYNADNYCYDNILIKDTYPADNCNSDINGFLSCFAELEPIDNNWQDYLKNMTDASDTLGKALTSDTADFDLYLKNIAVYFIWRYFLKGVYDEEILSKVFLMAVSVAMIKLMYINEKADTEERYSIIAKNYSKEIEYSEENLEKIYDMVYDNPAFSKANLMSII